MVKQIEGNPILEAALNYAKKDFYVLPLHGIRKDKSCTCSRPDCSSPGKHPRINDWQNKASKTPNTIKGWFKRWPESNVGILTGSKCKLLVWDVDPRNGGNESFSELENTHGKLPDTPEVLTGGGGNHYYFRSKKPVDTRKNALPGIDVMADPGYVVAAPSLHASGKKYEWELSSQLDDVELAGVPEWILELANKPRLTKAEKVLPTEIPEGTRNMRLCSMAGALRNKGCVSAEILVLLKEINKRCNPPADDIEIQSITDWISEKEPGNNYSISLLRKDTDALDVASNKKAPKLTADDLGDNWLSERGDDFINVQQVWWQYSEGIWQRSDDEKLLLWELMKAAKKFGFQPSKSQRHSIEDYLRESCYKSTDIFNSDPNLLCLKNGVFNLDASKLLEHAPDFYFANQLDVSFDPDATCPLWSKCLDDWFPNDRPPLSGPVSIGLFQTA